MAAPYGLSITNPVLCGGGPGGEQDYLDRLRCPSGSPIRYRRLGSQIAEDEAFLKAPGVRWFPGRLAIAMGVTPDGPHPLSIDVYEIECACGEHSTRVFMDMYHRGSDNATRCIELAGWTHQAW